MKQSDPLLELLERVGASHIGAVLVSEQELSRWDAAAVKALKAGRLLVKASPASSVVCPGCEEQCTMRVQTQASELREPAHFTVCDKREDINRVPVPVALLRQWRCSVEAVAELVSRNLGLRSESQRKAGEGLWELGLVTGRKRSQMLCLRTHAPLELVAGERAAPLSELVRFSAGEFSVDQETIRQLVDASTTGDSRYTPSTVKREARKLKTKALHEKWQKAFRKLKRDHPEKSDKWCSDRIAKMGIEPKRSAETIRKHMNG